MSYSHQIHQLAYIIYFSFYDLAFLSQINKMSNLDHSIVDLMIIKRKQQRRGGKGMRGSSPVFKGLLISLGFICVTASYLPSSEPKMGKEYSILTLIYLISLVCAEEAKFFYLRMLDPCLWHFEVVSNNMRLTGWDSNMCSFQRLHWYWPHCIYWK